jgi:hypothetical protein
MNVSLYSDRLNVATVDVLPSVLSNDLMPVNVAVPLVANIEPSVCRFRVLKAAV